MPGLHKRALAVREAHLALLDLKKVVDEATQTTHAVELDAVHLAIRSRPLEETSTSFARCSRTCRFAELRGYVE
jgi:hypothetical protein